VRISSEITNGKFIVSVSDRGCGMSAEDITLIGAYSQFHRADREQQGSGLGLAIAGRIAELHNGMVAVESQPGAGTTVKVTLPAA
jgi:signal transduction histidine kinase